VLNKIKKICHNNSRAFIMGKLILILISISLLLASVMITTARSNDVERCDEIQGYVKPAPNEVSIRPGGIGVPLNLILLVRQNAKYCAIKFTRYWTEKDGKEKYATYEVYDQQDGTGSFMNKNVKFIKGQASFLPPRGFFYPLIWQPGKPEITCGRLKLVWSPWCNVCHVGFFNRGEPAGDYGIELAPTPWTDIREVNVFEPLIKWYKYDENRKEGINIPIDKLFQGKEERKIGKGN
jgi:hypothetical protein